MTHPWLKSYPDDLHWETSFPAMPVPALLDKTVEQYGARPAFDFMGKTFTYADMGELVDRTAKGLQDRGVKKGVHVGLFLPNCPYFPVAYYGVLKAGGTVVNFNPLYAERELVHQITDSEIDMMFTLDLQQLTGKLEKVMGETRLRQLIICKMTDILPFPKNLLFPLLKRKEVAKIPEDLQHTWFEALVENNGDFTPVDIDPEDDIAVLQYTGGTTGTPKGAMLTHANVSINAQQAAYWLNCPEKGVEKMMAVIPFFHVFAMTAVMNLSILEAAEIIALPRFELDTVMKTIHAKKPTIFPAVPTIYTAINNHPDREKYDLSSIKVCNSGGAPLPVEVKQRFEESTGCVVVEGYGLTESAPVAVCNPRTGVNKAGSIGLPLPHTTIEIVSMEDGQTLMPPGEKGELCIRGPQVMKGYWKKPEETADVLKDGRLHTGDVAYMDEDGYVFIVDRIKDLILAGGYNIYPRNVEEAIYLHPAVEECVVGGVPDEYRGETVKAWIKLKDGQVLSRDELKTFLKDKLSPMEIPKVMDFRDEPLPKTMIGKLSRKDLVEVEKAGQAAVSG